MSHPGLTVDFVEAEPREAGAIANPEVVVRPLDGQVRTVPALRHARPPHPPAVLAVIEALQATPGPVP